MKLKRLLKSKASRQEELRFRAYRMQRLLALVDAKGAGVGIELKPTPANVIQGLENIQTWPIDHYNDAEADRFLAVMEAAIPDELRADNGLKGVQKVPESADI